jgi:chemotaxis methyl-accepting protein methylase
MNKEMQQVIRAMNGVHKEISYYDESFLLKSLEKRLAATSCATIADYCQYLSVHGGEAEEFYRSLNITYSEFFRNPLTFDVLEQRILPALTDEKLELGRSEIRIWSAGCAAGQESYSVAILLEELISARKIPLSFRIFATDISDESLVSARCGVYDTTAVQNVKLKHFQSCFKSHNGSYSIDGRLKQKIEFSYYDLLDERSTCPSGSIYGDFDIVFCSNLLFYYTQETQQFILNKLCHSLSSGGYLVTGEAERAIVKRTGLSEIFPMSAVYRKTNERNVMI